MCGAMVARLTSIVIRYQKVAVSSTVTLIFFCLFVIWIRGAFSFETRLSPTNSILHVRPTTAATTDRWPVWVYDAGVDLHRYGVVWLDNDSTTTGFNWHRAVWVYSAAAATTATAAIYKRFWIYRYRDSRNGNRRWLIWIHESSTAAAAAATTTTTTATTGLALW